MASIQKFEDLSAWKNARCLTRRIYDLTGDGRLSRDFALRDQLRRAAISVMSNIAEGFERDGNREFIQFLSVAKSSTAEVRCQLYAAFDQGYLDRSTLLELQSLCDETSNLIGGLMRYLKRSDFKGSKYKNDV